MMKKQHAGRIGSILLSGLRLTGCGSDNPADTVDGFLSSFKDGDLKKAGSYIEGGGEKLLSDTEDEEFAIDMLEAIQETYTFEDPEKASEKDNEAKVKAKITSVDVSTAMTAAIADVMPLAFANAFEEDTEKSDKMMEDMMTKKVLKNLKDEDADMATRTVEFTLKKNKDGEYKIVADDNLRDAVFANASDLENAFGGDSEEE